MTLQFDTKCAFLEDLIFWYFYNGLRPLIKLSIDKKERELDSEEKLIKKAIRAKVKPNIQSVTSQNMDQHCYCRNQLVYASL